MKYLPADTPGGRMRDVRYSQGKSLKALASDLGVTGNYLGLVERGERKPSQTLLKEFAEKMGVSYDWLVNGDAEPNKKSAYQNEEYEVSADAVNPRLFLSVILMYAKVTRDTLVDIVNVPANTVDEIFNGVSKIKDVDIAPNWVEVFPVLAQQADISALRHDLHNIDVFLKGREDVKIRDYMHQLLSRLKRENAELFENAEIEVYDWQADDDTSSSMDLCIPITVKDKKSGTPVWCFCCYPRLNDIDADTARDMYDSAVSVLESSGCKVSIIVKSSAAHDKFYNLDAEFEIQDEELANTDRPVPYRPKITAIWFDAKNDEYEELLMYDEEDDSERG